MKEQFIRAIHISLSRFFDFDLVILFKCYSHKRSFRILGVSVLWKISIDNVNYLTISVDIFTKHDLVI